MILFLHGEDTFLVGRRRRSLQEAFREKNSGAEVVVFDFEDARSPADIRQALQACEENLFAQKKMIIFLHPLLVDEPGEEALLNFLKSEAVLAENVYLFVAPGKIKKTHPLAKTLQRLAEKVEEFPKIDEGSLRAFAKKELERIDGRMSFSGGTLELLLSLVGTDTARLVQELEKLALYKEGEVIDENDVRALVSDDRSREKVVFEALDALGRGQKEAALLLFREEAAKADGVYGILALCAWQVRKLLAIREVTDNGLSQAGEIARSLKLPPFAVERALRSIRDFPQPRLKKGLIFLSDLDVQMKQGEIAPEVALDLFVWKF